MAKTKNPTPVTETPKTEVPAVDLAPLRKLIFGKLEDQSQAEAKSKECTLDIAFDIADFIEENPTVERESIVVLAREAVAEIRGVKPEQIEKSPDKKLKETRPDDYSKRNSAYVLISNIMSIAWPKKDEQKKAVAKLREKGEDRFTVLLKAAQKPQGASSRGNQGEKGKITKDNFVEKLKAFLTKAATDTAESLDEILDLVSTDCDDTGALSMIRAENEATQVAKEESETKK